MHNYIEVIKINNVDIAIKITLVISLILMTSIIFYRFRKKRNTYIRKLDSLLKQVQKNELRSIIIPDGIGGLIEIERLLLLEQGLVIVETYPIAGHLFGADNIDQWTQIIDGRSFKFTNPLNRIHNTKHALQLLAPRLPIFCRVIFTENSNFPKGKPAEVSVLSSLEQDLKPILQHTQMTKLAEEAWDRIIRIARTDGQSIYRES
ncbi:hypothetical protein LCGC14_1156780 [marine sediment metagenome]|uniref:NERD domain-containing protein n=1 Tax=marine sediment metagenome TaxID=412755 RepID=A0A0F9MGX0_9ZZZZ